MKDERDILQFRCISCSLLLPLGLGFNLKSGVLMLATSCFRWFFWLENIEGKEADRFLSMVVAKGLMAGRADI